MQSFEQIEAFAENAGNAPLRDLRSSLNALQTHCPPAGDPARERWQRAHDRLSAELNARTIHRRFAISLIFGAVVVLLVMADMLLR